jgi:hypothetical protein
MNGTQVEEALAPTSVEYRPEEQAVQVGAAPKE